MNVERTEQAMATGARTIAVGCPFCMTMITDGTKAKNAEGAVQVKDVAELVAERLRPSDSCQSASSERSRVGYCYDRRFRSTMRAPGTPSGRSGSRR